MSKNYVPTGDDEACYVEEKPAPRVWITRDGYTRQVLSIGIVQRAERKHARQHYIELTVAQAKALVKRLQERIAEAGDQ